jgi:hypothetical protein
MRTGMASVRLLLMTRTLHPTPNLRTIPQPYILLLAILHLGLGALWLACTPPLPLMLAGLLVLMGGWGAARCEAEALTRDGVRALVPDTDHPGRWQAMFEDGRSCEVHLDCRGWVSPALTLFTLTLMGRRYLCVIDDSCMDAQMHRRLRVSLLHARTRPATVF